jgi:hypothetical protein
LGSERANLAIWRSKEMKLSSNFRGACLGGFLGILGCGLIAPAWIIVGCFVGVILGYYWFQLGSILKEAGSVLRAEVATQQASHPMDNVWLPKCLAAIAYFAIHFLVARYVFCNALAEKTAVAVCLCIVIPMIQFLMIMIGYSMGSLWGEKSYADLRRYFREYEILSNRGMIGLFAYDLGRRFTMGLYGFWYFVATTMVMAALGPLTLALVAIVTALVLVLKGIYSLLQRPDHRLCLTVTLIVTSVMAWLFRGSLHGMGLWLVALATGILAGLTTETVSKLVASRVVLGGMLAELAQKPLSAFTKPRFDAFNRIFDRTPDPYYFAR